MKKIPLLFALLFVLAGCSEHQSNNAETIKWIKTHPKPISVYKFGSYESGDNRYTLIDSAGDIYDTRGVSLQLPYFKIEKP